MSSDFIEYTVKVYPDGSKMWRNKGGLLHREDGPAVEHAGGFRYWYLNGDSYTEEEWQAKINPPAPDPCDGKVVEIDGKKYRLSAV